MKDEVESFIQEFKKLHSAELEDSFLNGNCYWFAYILKSRFGTGSIIYCQIDNHFLYKLSESYYDIRGKVHPPQDATDWIQYMIDEPLDASRVLRDCVYKT